MKFVWKDENNGHLERDFTFGSTIVGITSKGVRPLNCLIECAEFDTPIKMPLSAYLYKVKIALQPGGRVIII